MSEPELVSYNYGEAPEAIILDRCPNPYPMELVGDEAELVERLVNQGIDSHLQACFIKGADDYQWKKHTLDNGSIIAVKLHCSVSPKSMVVLLRRLLEVDSEAADSLRSAILETLKIEEM